MAEIDSICEDISPLHPEQPSVNALRAAHTSSLAITYKQPSSYLVYPLARGADESFMGEADFAHSQESITLCTQEDVSEPTQKEGTGAANAEEVSTSNVSTRRSLRRRPGILGLREWFEQGGGF